MEQMTNVTLITMTSNDGQKPRESAMTTDGRRDHHTDLALGDLTLHAGIVDV